MGARRAAWVFLLAWVARPGIVDSGAINSTALERPHSASERPAPRSVAEPLAALDTRGGARLQSLAEGPNSNVSQALRGAGEPHGVQQQGGGRTETGVGWPKSVAELRGLRDPSDACTAARSRPYSALAEHSDAKIVDRYLETCRMHQVQPSPDALAQLQLGTDTLTIFSTEQHFGDLEMRALTTFLEDGNGTELQGIHTLDLSKCSLGPSGMLLVAQLLENPKCCIQVLDVSYQGIGPEGVQAIATAVGRSSAVKELRMKQCGIADQGGSIILDLLQTDTAPRLRHIDIQNNFIGFTVCSKLLQVALERGVQIELAGNRVLDEVLNAVTHGVGEVFAVIGTVLLAVAVRKKPPHYKWTVALYCASLNAMYLFSTLFHSFFALGRTTVYIFGIFDYSAIFLLIAGSYTPILGILFHGEGWAALLLGAMWVTAICGICTAAFYTGPFAMALRLTLYLTMGWTTLSCICSVVRELGKKGTLFLFAGGVFYTVGVPFFVRNGHTAFMPDHAIWHLFVLGGSGCHFFCIYMCCASRPVKENTDYKALHGAC